MKGIDNTAKKLLNMVNTAASLKRVSVYLESLSLSKTFKAHAKNIANDEDLTDQVKAKELLDLLDKVNHPVVYKFFESMFKDGEFWLFSSKHFDYFDQFVQSFQLMTEEIALVNIVSAIEIKEKDIEKLSLDLAKGLDKHVILHTQVNPDILGGAQIRMGNLVFDYTLKSKFAQFKRQWVSKLAKTSELVGRE